MLKVIIDTNVILSGLLFGGKPALLLNGIQKQQFIFCISQELFDEIFDKLTNKFFVDATILDDVSMILSYGVDYLPKNTVHFPIDQKDEYLLELAQTCKADYLISGDKKHLLPLKKWKSTKIISPAEAVELLLT